MMKGVKVYELDATCVPVRAYGRRDLYKICLVTGHSILHYPERSITVSGTCLLFGNPYQPYSSEVVTGTQTGYSCLFTETFLRANQQFAHWQQSPLCKLSCWPVVVLRDKQAAYFTSLFENLLREQRSPNTGSNERLRHYVQLLLRESVHLHRPASSRIFTSYCRPADGSGVAVQRRIHRHSAKIDPADE